MSYLFSKYFVESGYFMVEDLDALHTNLREGPDVSQ